MTEKTEKEKCMDYLFGDPNKKTIGFNVFLGDDPNITEEDVYRECNKIFEQERLGLLKECVDIDKEIKTFQTVEEFLKGDENGND